MWVCKDRFNELEFDNLDRFVEYMEQEMDIVSFGLRHEQSKATYNTINSEGKNNLFICEKVLATVK